MSCIAMHVVSISQTAIAVFFVGLTRNTYVCMFV